MYNFFILLSRAVNKNNNKKLLSPIEWDEVLNIAGRHNVYALVFEKASEIPEFLFNSNYNSYMLKAMEQVSSQARQTYAFLELYRAFSENALYPIVMKGIVCRLLYGEYCDYRPSGDEDILIRKEDYELAEIILKNQGYVSEYNQITQQELDELQEVSFYNIDTHLHIELHVNPIGRENQLRDKMNDLFEHVFDNYREIKVDE